MPNVEPWSEFGDIRIRQLNVAGSWLHWYSPADLSQVNGAIPRAPPFSIVIRRNETMLAANIRMRIQASRPSPSAVPLLSGANRLIVCLALGLTAAMLTGCGGGDAPILSVQSKPESLILGTWDAKLVINDDYQGEIPESSLQIAKSSDFRFEYRENGDVRMSVRAETPETGVHSNEAEGKWELVNETGTEIELRVRYDGGEKESVRLVIIDQDTIETAAPEDLNDLGILRMTRAMR
jgi:hypothetical protein